MSEQVGQQAAFCAHQLQQAGQRMPKQQERPWSSSRSDHMDLDAKEIRLQWLLYHMHQSSCTTELFRANELSLKCKSIVL